MPKSKEQKRKEADERFRKHKEMKRYQVGGDIYHDNLVNYGVHIANEKAREAYKSFKTKCEKTDSLSDKPSQRNNDDR